MYGNGGNSFRIKIWSGITRECNLISSKKGNIMRILIEKVQVAINGHNIKHYTDEGYNVFRYYIDDNTFKYY